MVETRLDFQGRWMVYIGPRKLQQHPDIAHPKAIPPGNGNYERNPFFSLVGKGCELGVFQFGMLNQPLRIGGFADPSFTDK